MKPEGFPDTLVLGAIIWTNELDQGCNRLCLNGVQPVGPTGNENTVLLSPTLYSSVVNWLLVSRGDRRTGQQLGLKTRS